MKKTKDNTQTGKNSKNERIRACTDDTGMDRDESLDTIIEHMQNQIVDYMSIRGGVVSKPEVMFVFGESDITRDAIDGLIDDEKIAVVNGELTTIWYYFPKA